MNMTLERIELFYRKNLLKLMFIPLIALVLAFIIIGFKFANTGDFFDKDVTLKGGIIASVYTNNEIDYLQLEEYLGVNSVIRNLADLSSGRNLGFIVEVSDLKGEELEQKLEEYLKIELNSNNFSIEETDSKLGETFFKQLLIALMFAFVLMAISVFVTFRVFIPSIAVICSAMIDIFVTLAIVNLLGLKISTAGIVAFLLIIGYSVDTDILLTTNVLRNKRDIPLYARIKRSIKTGLTMTSCTMAAVALGYIFGQSPVFKEMFAIIFIALFVDIFSTYLTNAGWLVLYCKKKGIE